LYLSLLVTLESSKATRFFQTDQLLACALRQAGVSTT
jgi:hypothetical protein